MNAPEPKVAHNGPVYCHRCGHGNPPGSTYCGNCSGMLNP